MRILYNCKNLEQLTIHLHFSQAVTTPFRDFISTLILKTGLPLRKLSITMTVMHFRVLDALLTSKRSLPKLRVMDLTILPSYITNKSKQIKQINPSVDITESFRKYLLSLFSSARSSLESLNITNYDLIELSPVFMNMEGFSSLNEFRYQGYGRAHNLSDPQVLDKLVKTSHELKQFSFEALGHSLWPTGPPVNYFEDVNWPYLSKNSFALKLTDQRNLCIQLPESLLSLDLDTLSPSLIIFSSKMKHLVINPVKALTYLQFRQILGGVAKVCKDQDRGDELESLVFRRLELFSAAHLNEIFDKIPSLKILTIGFEQLSIDPVQRTVRLPLEKSDDIAYSRTIHFQRANLQSRTEFEAEIFTKFRTFGYVTSRLEHLYLARWSKTFRGPNVRNVPPQLLENLAAALPKIHVAEGFST